MLTRTLAPLLARPAAPPARPTLLAPTGLTGYHRLSGPAGRTRFPSVGDSPAVDPYGAVGVGTGQIGPCASFNGTDAVLHVGAKGGFDATGGATDFTITFAVNPDLWAGSGYTIVCGQAAGSDRSWEIRAGSGGFFYFDWRDLSGANKTDLLSVPAGSVPTGSWTRVAITFTQSTGTLATWINGTQINTVTTTGVKDYTLDNPPKNLPVVLGGRFDATQGPAGFPYYRMFTGRIEGFAVYSRVLSGAEMTALDSADPTMPAGVTLILDEPQDGDVVQADATGAGTAVAGGWWNGRTAGPGRWLYSLGDGPRAWSPTVSGQTFTGTIPLPRGGPLRRRLRVWWEDDPLVVSAAWVSAGRVYVAFGQSNVTGAGTNLQPCPPSAAGFVAARTTHDWKVRPLAEVGSHGNGYYGLGASAFISSLGGDLGSLWPHLGTSAMARLGMPVKVVNQSRGSTYITDWARDATDPRNPSTSYGSLLLALESLPTPPACLIFQHGETDAVSGTLQADYESALDTLVTNLWTDAGLRTGIVRVQHVGTGADQATAVRAAQAAVIAGNAHAFDAGDLNAAGVAVDGGGVHFVSDSQLLLAAQTIDAGVAAAGY